MSEATREEERLDTVNVLEGFTLTFLIGIEDSESFVRNSDSEGRRKRRDLPDSLLRAVRPTRWM